METLDQLKSGFDYLNQGQLDKASQIAKYLQSQYPENIDVITLLGLCYFKLKNFSVSVEYLEKAKANKSFDQYILLLYIENLMHLGQIDEAIEEIEQKNYVFTNENFRLLKIKLYEINGDYKKAIIEANKLKTINNETLKLESLAWNYELTNQVSEAKEVVDTLLSKNKNNFKANLVSARLLLRKSKLKKGINHLKNIRKDSLSKLNKSIYYSVKAQLLEKQNKFSKAFKFYSKSNKQLKSTDAYNLIKGDGFYSYKIVKIVDQYFKTRPKFEIMVPCDEAITFMVGLPRSGTTLLENILNSHPSITTIEEKPLVDELLEPLFDKGLKSIKTLSLKDIEILQNKYLTAREKHQNKEAQIVIDKLPLNIVHIGLLYRIFPNAKFIISLRDIRDVSLSCFFQNFQLNNAMVNFLDWNQTQKYLFKIIEHSFDVIRNYPINFKIINYEELIKGPFIEVKRLLRFLNLDWDDSIYNYRKNLIGKNIITPSYAAVSSKINSNRKNRWKNFKRQVKDIDVEYYSALINLNK